MEKAKEYFYSKHTDLVQDEHGTVRIARGGHIDKALEIAYLEGVLSGDAAHMSGQEEWEFENRLKELLDE